MSIVALAAVGIGWITHRAAPEDAVRVAMLPEIGPPQATDPQSLDDDLAVAADEQRRLDAEAKALAEAAAKAGAEAAEAKAKAEAEAEARAEAERKAAAEEAARSIERAVDDPKSAARALMVDYEWGDEQFACLDNLWTRESNWRYTARNPSSGAYGIPQSLPASKMARFGDDYRTNPVTQIKWGLWYIEDRYGTPCEAWAHSQASGWY